MTSSELSQVIVSASNIILLVFWVSSVMGFWGSRLELLVSSFFSSKVNPKKLSRSQRRFYRKLIRVAEKREAGGPRPIVVITDVGKDYDDLTALVVLKELHRLRLVELRLVVVNLLPAEKRAHLAKAALESLGLGDIPVACGTRGSPDDHEVLDHEFKEAEFGRDVSGVFRDGQALLLEAYENAKERNEKLHLLCLSSLQDIQQFASEYPALVAAYTAEVHMQGGNYISEEGYLVPDSKAANNRFNLDAAKKWHSFIQMNDLTSYTYTKIAAFAAPLNSCVFEELEATGHAIGAYLRRVQVEQDVAFYKRACESDPEKRFAPFMDQKWFLANKTNWHLRPHPSAGDALPVGEEVVPYLSKLVVYDAQAALGVAGQDIVAALKVFQSRDRSIQGRNLGSNAKHWIIGDEQSTAVPGEISLALSTLMKGSLLISLGGMAVRTMQQERTKFIPKITRN